MFIYELSSDVFIHLQHTEWSTYDQMFHVDEGYNLHLHRDDRQYTVGLDMPSEVATFVIFILKLLYLPISVVI